MSDKIGVQAVKVINSLILFTDEFIDTILTVVYLRASIVIAAPRLVVIVFIVHALTSL